MNEIRERVIRLLDEITARGERMNSLVNALCRQVGLYPYQDDASSNWRDAFAKSMFMVQTGEREEQCLHVEQSRVLKMLLEGKNVALSAPTSFGKSYIIDAFISLKKPSNIVIVVPTIALMDEARRRIMRKFSSDYKIITQTGEKPAEKNIYIFPQERVFSYLKGIGYIDILIVDEFYKASLNESDDARVTSLQKAIVALSKVARQRYFLMPNVQSINHDSQLMQGMEFVTTDFQTVSLIFHDEYLKYDNCQEKKCRKQKEAALKDILLGAQKTLVYASTVAQIHQVLHVIEAELRTLPSNQLVSQFAEWVERHYGKEFYLVNVLRCGCGIHNGQLHRALCQFQVDMFNLEGGLVTLISTSSMIEGVNTAAKNIVLWSNSVGKSKMDYFTYKNIAGRAGRMFQYFVGHVYNLVKPPAEKMQQLNLDFTTDCTLMLATESGLMDLPEEKVEMVRDFYSRARELSCDMIALKRALADSSIFMKLDDFIRAIESMKNVDYWEEMNKLNAPVVASSEKTWGYLLAKIIRGRFSSKMMNSINPAYFIPYVIYASMGWDVSVPRLISDVNKYAASNPYWKKPIKDFDYDAYFRAEKWMTYQFHSYLNDYNIAYNLTHYNEVNINPFLTRLSKAFLPGPVFALEEFGLPRWISKRISDSGVIDLTCEEMSVNDAIVLLKQIGLKQLLKRLQSIQDFDYYILERFYAGV